jgi:hypothetical protein
VRAALSAYSQSVGALTASLLRRKSQTGSSPAVETFRFICYLDRIPPHILEDTAFRMLAANGEVGCELEAEDFAGAVAEAIRTLEVDFVHVLGIERLV